jgi:hypothetical protein
MGKPERFFFVHLQKTGGTALFQRLREGFGPAAVYPTPEDRGDVRAVTDVGHLRARLREHGDDLRVITGHFPYCTIAVLGGPFTTFTLLRHPVDRTLSLLRRRKLVEPRFQDMELEAIYEDPVLQDIIRNHMVKMLSLTPDEMGATPLTVPVTFDDDRLERAKGNLARIDVVGLQEHFDDFCAALEARIGRSLGAPRFANRTPRSPVTAALRERIAADNQADIQLYRFAEGLVEDRGRREHAIRG